MIGISIMKKLKDPTDVFLVNGETFAFVMLFQRVKFWGSHQLSDKIFQF